MIYIKNYQKYLSQKLLCMYICPILKSLIKFLSSPHNVKYLHSMSSILVVIGIKQVAKKSEVIEMIEH